jgi:hypothetical protein
MMVYVNSVFIFFMDYGSGRMMDGSDQ